MFSLRNRNKQARTAEEDQGRELQKLRRQDLLELLLDQMREADRLRSELADTEARDAELRERDERLRARLDEKDAQIARLGAKLDAKDAALAATLASAREIAAAGSAGERTRLLLSAEDLLADGWLSQPAAAPEGGELS